MLQQLNLDEAWITINNTLKDEGVKLLYQLEECRGCPLATIKEIPKLSTFEIRVTTKYQVNLQLRDNTTNVFICNWQETFNDQGHYALEVFKTPSGRNCSFNTLDEGHCLLCPLAVFLFAIIIFSSLETIFKFVCGKRKSNLNDGEIDKSTEVKIVAAEDISAEANIELSKDLSKDESSNGAKYITEGESEEGLETPQVTDGPINEINNVISNSEIFPDTSLNKTSSRVESLDIFRGLTIAGMIFVNYGGAGYVFLDHKVWDGLTIADFVFPFFIFILGFSIPISIRSMMKSNVSASEVLWKISRRSLLLFLIGLCLNSMHLKDGDLEYLRIPGVLQRFSISYLAVATTYYMSSLIQRKLSQCYPRRIGRLNIIPAGFEIIVSIGWLVIYIYYTFFWDYDSSCPIGYTGPGGISDEGRYYNCTGGAASFIDRYLLGQNHLYQDHEVKDMYLTNVSHDPEGILGCSTSILLTMVGLQLGKILLGYKSHKQRLRKWLNWIIISGLTSGLAFFIPINKRLWSLTYISVMALSASVVYCGLYIVIDMFKIRRTLYTRMLSSAGKNPLFLYIGHSMCSSMFPWFFAVDENSHAWLLARLTWATTLWLLIAHWMSSRSILIKI